VISLTGFYVNKFQIINPGHPAMPHSISESQVGDRNLRGETWVARKWGIGGRALVRGYRDEFWMGVRDTIS